MAFDNPETLTLLGACAAWTERVRLVTTVVVPQLHDPVLLAKALATGDLLSDGRLTVGLGVGGREEDYRAAGADLATQTMGEMAERVALMRRVWAGEKVTEATLPSDPRRSSPAARPCWSAPWARSTIRSAAPWADGLAGVTLDLDTSAVAALFALARDAWADAGRPAPHARDVVLVRPRRRRRRARAQVHRHLRHYMNWLPAGLVDALAPPPASPARPTSCTPRCAAFAASGADEVHLIPTGRDVGQVARVAEVVAADWPSCAS